MKENTIINDDCLNILRQLPDKSIDLVLTDPPYGINICKMAMGYKKSRKNVWGGKNWDSNPPSQEVFDEIFRVSKNQIIWGGNNYGYASRCYLVWDKGEGFYNRSFAECEIAYTSFDSNCRIFKYDPLAHGDYKEKIHPTQKPITLFEWCLLKYSNENDLILDPFSGSGTTAVAAYRTKRRFICVEKDVDYYRASLQRLENAQKQLDLF